MFTYIFTWGDPHVDFFPRLALLTDVNSLNVTFEIRRVRSPFQRLSADFKFWGSKGLFHHLGDGVSGCYFVDL